MPERAPLVSVVLPVYNHERFLDATLASVVDQTHGPVELIAVDDASTDGSHGVLESWSRRPEVAERFVRVLVLRNERNRGAHYSLNKGAVHAEGRYVSFLNSDDRYHADRLRALVEAAAESGTRLAMSAVSCRFEGAPTLADVRLADRLEQGPSATLQNAPSTSWALCEWNVAVSTGNIFCEASLVAEAGGFKNLKFCHDWDFLLRCALRTEPAFVTERLYDYTIHKTNSFRDLGGVAGAESGYVLDSYFEAAAAFPPPNASCPSPWNQPATFDRLMGISGLREVHDRVFKPYRQGHRTVDLNEVGRHQRRAHRSQTHGSLS